ncbi:hypothetical protein QSV34_00565 [Porticoccus sp. W117]|uniref:CAF17-like 4Fe-4S cluster assembly/insertion protein YgfZ n=1 Tax=Porticoccus sp. W117 TaxID=3054777 RepID=UPI002591D4E6|nr:hypothetical protein [Porticoccus sp. W117]MDM3869835.1 hypothetical protein [Porticoccus sp. W117]
MDSWHHFLQQKGLQPKGLQQQGAQFDGDQLIGFGEQAADYPALLNTTLLFPLQHWATLTLQDGALENGSHKLLQGQLTCDLDKLASDSTLFGAHCTPKGRAVANFHLVQNNRGHITLILPVDQLESTTASLNKYAPFFRATLEAGSWSLLGLAGEQTRPLCENVLGIAPESPGQAVHCKQGTAICLEDNHLLLLVAPEHRQNIWEQLSNSATPAGPELWELLNIRAGIGHIRAATSEEFIPQMLNMQASHGKNGAISFKKGCYTGQEVVARMHYLGKLKRRMYRLQTQQTDIAIGDHCYLPDQTQSQGNVVNVARSDQGVTELLAVMTEKAAASEQLAFGTSADNAQPMAVSQLPLPYALEP